MAVAWVAGALPLAFLGTPDKAGEFGDTFGAINALFSGLAFAGVVYAIFLQRQDLALQREELSKVSGANIRQVHITLQQMALDDPDLQEVWETAPPQSDKKEVRQLAYVNLILSQVETLHATGALSSGQLSITASTYMRKPLFRRFWERASGIRRLMAEAGTSQAREFHAILQSAYDAAP